MWTSSLLLLHVQLGSMGKNWNHWIKVENWTQDNFFPPLEFQKTHTLFSLLWSALECEMDSWPTLLRRDHRSSADQKDDCCIVSHYLPLCFWTTAHPSHSWRKKKKKSQCQTYLARNITLHRVLKDQFLSRDFNYVFLLITNFFFFYIFRGKLKYTHTTSSIKEKKAKTKNVKLTVQQPLGWVVLWC